LLLTDDVIIAAGATSGNWMRRDVMLDCGSGLKNGGAL